MGKGRGRGWSRIAREQWSWRAPTFYFLDAASTGDAICTVSAQESQKAERRKFSNHESRASYDG